MTKIRITLENNKSMTFELYEDKAPITVSNFLSLIDSHYFDNLIFHRIIKGFMAQGGGYILDETKNELNEAPKLKPIKGEFKSNGIENDIKHVKGVISMARTMDKNSATSQFFIMTADSPHLDNEYAAFGMAYGDDSFKAIDELDNARTVNVGGGLTDFPYPVIRIKTIERI